MTDPHEAAHIVGRLAGEGLDHPRQKIIRWLQEKLPSSVASYNEDYEQALASHATKKLIGKETYASYEAFGRLPFAQALGGAGTPEVDDLWACLVDPDPVPAPAPVSCPQ